MHLVLGYVVWLLLIVDGNATEGQQDLEIYPSARVWSTNYSGLLYSIQFCGGDLIVQLGSLQLSASVDGKRIIQTNNSYFNAAHHPHNKTCAIARIYATQGLMNNLEWILKYGSSSKLFNRAFSIQNCSKNMPGRGPKISASRYTYNTPGQFVCPAGQELFYSDSTPGVTNTICQNHATWYGSNGIECWGGSGVHLKGNFSGKAGQFLILNCMYNESVYPIGDLCNISVGGEVVVTAALNSSFPLHLTREMNGKFVHCQPITNYTKIKPEKGWSKPKLLNITYKPHWIKMPEICFHSCTVYFFSNPPPINGTLSPLAKQGNIKGSDFKTVNATEGRYSYTFQSTQWPYGVYTLEVANSIGKAICNFTLAESTTISTATTETQPSLIPTVTAIAGGAAVFLGFMVSLKLYCKRKKCETDEKEERGNPLYGTSNGAKHYQVNEHASKINEKIKSKEIKTNVAYQLSPESPDAIEEAYGPVNGGKKEEKLNILYEAAGPSTRSDETYAQVDKHKKKQKLKAMKVNVAYVPTPENPDAPEEAYAEVDKTKKKKGEKQKSSKNGDTAIGSMSQASTNKSDEYAVVIKKVKTSDSKNSESSGGATYAVVSKSKKKKKEPPPPPEPPSVSDEDPYAEVELHGKEDK